MPKSNEPTDWNPRYLVYARSQGTPDPDERLRLDSEKYHGGKMAGFILWIGDQWVAWRAARGLKLRDMDFLTKEDHADFDAFISVRFPVDEAREREAFKLEAGSL